QVPCTSSAASPKLRSPAGCRFGRWQADRETSADDAQQPPVAEGGRLAGDDRRATIAGSKIFGPDAAAVGGDDFATNAETEARVLADGTVRLRAIRIEAGKDVFELVGRHPRPLIVEGDFDVTALAPGFDGDDAAVGRERQGVVEQVGQHTSE